MTAQKVKVVTYKGDKAAEKGIERMLGQGWQLQNQSSRKMLWRPTTGVFTKKQKHTITFVQ